MSLFINKDFNSLVITDEDFKIDYNYLPDILLGLRNLDPTKPVNIVVSLEDTPAVFILYFRKLMQEADTDINIYYKDTKESMRKILDGYGMKYRNIEEYPKPMPQ